MFTTTVHQCRYGLRSPDDTAKLRKATKFCTNMTAVQVHLILKCGVACPATEHRAIQGTEYSAKEKKTVSTRYPDGLVAALCQTSRSDARRPLLDCSGR